MQTSTHTRTDARAHTARRDVAQAIGLFLSNTILAISGCGSASGPRTQGAGDGDRETWPSTIIEDDEILPAEVTEGTEGTDDTPASSEEADYGDYTIVASQMADEGGSWEFEVASTRGKPTSDFVFSWDFGDGQTHNGANQAYTYTEPGPQLITVTATDGKGNTVFVLTLEIEIPVPNQPPTADAGDDQTVDENALVFLYGGDSFDADGADLNYLWTQAAGQPVQLLDATEPTVRFIAPSIDEDTELRFTLTVNDGELTSQDSVTVHVMNFVTTASHDPVANAGPDQVVTEFSLVTLDGTQSSGAGNAELSFEWVQLLGPSVTLGDATAAVATFEAPAAGGQTIVLIFELVVTEGDVSAGDEVAIAVEPDPTDEDEPPPPPPPDDCTSDADCDDGVFCNGDETCVGGECTAGSYPCAGMLCDEGSDSCAACLGDADCADGVFCNGDESCMGGACVGGADPCGGLPCDEQADTCDVGALTAAYSETGVVLDGIVEANEWSSAQTYAFNGRDSVPPGVVVVGSTADSSDTSATLRLMHDADYIYVAVEVQDDTLVLSAPNPWEADSVDVFMDVDNSDTPSTGYNRFQITVSADGQAATAGAVPEGAWQGVAELSQEGYAVECRIDKSATGLANGQTYGFDVAITDAEPSSGVFETRYFYFAMTDAATDESQWGDLFLAPPPDDPALLAVSPTSLDFGPAETSRIIEVWNSGGGTLTYTVADDAGWLAVSPPSGESSGEHDPITVALNRTGLSAGDYEGEIVVIPSVGSAVSIIVLMSVAPPSAERPTARIVSSRIVGTSPLAVFFEGTTSTDVAGKSIDSAGLHGNELVEYTWTITRDADNDGVFEADEQEYEFSGFNAAYVFEPPGPTTCHDGSSTGGVCNPDASCPGGACVQTCSGGNMDGNPCDCDVDCPGGTCVAACSDSGESCDPDADCPGRVCNDLGTKGEPSGAGGRYRVRLTVRESSCNGGVNNGGPCASDDDCLGGTCGLFDWQEQEISVRPFGGTTYYVDNTSEVRKCSSGSGNQGASCSGDGDCLNGTCVTTSGDMLSGDSPEQAWQTYAKAFGAIGARSMVKPGDRVLFRRGQTFPYDEDVMLNDVVDVVIGAFGSGCRPVIQYAGTTGGVGAAAVRFVRGADAISLVDLQFNGQSTANGSLAQGVAAAGGANLLFLRSQITNYLSNSFYVDGLFIVDSVFTNAERQNMFFSGSRLAMAGNSLGPVTLEHNLYGSSIDRGVITRTEFHDSARSGLRIAANSAPGSRNVVVSENEFRATPVALDLKVTSPNKPYWGENLLIERNHIVGAGWAIANSDTNGYRHVTIRSNLIELQESGAVALFLRVDNASTPQQLGIQSLRFHNNTVSTASAQPAIWIETPNHTGVEIFNNIFQSTSGALWMRFLRIKVAETLGQVTCNNNLYHAPNRDTTLFEVAADHYTFDQWKDPNIVGQDTLSRVLDPGFDPASPSGYELLGDSPGVDAGRLLPGVFDDYRGRRRSDGRHDMGAFER